MLTCRSKVKTKRVNYCKRDTSASCERRGHGWLIDVVFRLVASCSISLSDRPCMKCSIDLSLYIYFTSLRQCWHDQVLDMQVRKKVIVDFVRMYD